MENYDFILENLRFHVYQENTLIFIGWYREDNPEQRHLEVYLDDRKLDIVYHNKKGIPIRQKYLRYAAGVSEEINAAVELPEDWRSAKELRIYCINGTQRVLTKSFKRDWLLKCRKRIESYIETNQYIEGKLVLTGWAVAQDDIEFQLLDRKGRPIPFQLAKSYRRDVIAVFDEVPECYEAGFKLTASVKKSQKEVLLLECKEKSADYDVTIHNMGKAAQERNVFVKALDYWRKYGLLAAAGKTAEKISQKLFHKERKGDYEAWQKKHAITEMELEQQRQHVFSFRPMFSIVVPLYRTPERFLRELMDSVMNQTYSNWELCLADGSGKDSALLHILEEYAGRDKRIRYQSLEKNAGISENTNAAVRMASGDYIVFADHDDTLPAEALFECAKVLNEDKDIEVIYSDEDKLDMSGKKRFEPHFKSDFNIDLLCSMNYICHLFVVKQELIRGAGMLRPEFDGAQDYDFILRCCEAARKVHHIPKILYHWRCHMESTAANPESKMYAFEAGRKAVEEHYQRIGIPASVEHGQFYGMYKTVFHWKEQPLISIIIPNKDHIADLKKCMDSIDGKSSYRNYEYVIVENNSTEKETFEYYKEIEKRENVRVVYYDGGFNFSAINNFGVTYAKGEYLLLLNNDTEIINPDCLKELLGYCMREDVGIVGARLYYEDDTIQHAGVVLGFGGIAGHAFIASSRYDNGYFSRIICAQDYSAVTAACMMTKRSVYEQAGGLTETFEVAFNDIDYCMKVRALGKLIVYNPAAELYHYESKSRGLEDSPEKIERFNSEMARFIEHWKAELERGDPYYNPNLTLDKADFSLNVS